MGDQNTEARCSVDMSHHLTPWARDLRRSEQKDIGKMIPEDLGAVSLSGGLPHQTLFPMSKATFSIPTFDSLDGDLSGWVDGSMTTEEIELIKTGRPVAGSLDIADIFQYGMTNGYPQVIKALEDLTFAVHGKPYSDAKVYLSIGSLDILHKCMRLLVEPGVDSILVDQYCYGSGTHTLRSWGARLHPIQSDSQGLIPEDLDRILSTWSTSAQGRKPHLMYLVPVGNNPTGAIMPSERYAAIYKLCQEHDIMILEDDPYFHLQFYDYNPDSTARNATLAEVRSRLAKPPRRSTEDDLAGVMSAFRSTNTAKSFLSRDVDGRVIRMDSMSKCFGPGFRFGWATCSASFLERFLRLAQISTQVTNNWSQAILGSYLSPEHWGLPGFVRWLFGLRLEYQQKRDFYLDCFSKYCPTDLVSTSPCGGAMYQWLTINIEKHPRFKPGLAHSDKNVASESTARAHTNARLLMDELYKDLMFKGKVLVMPGYLFVVGRDQEDAFVRSNHLRTCFAGDYLDIEIGVKALGDTISTFFHG